LGKHLKVAENIDSIEFNIDLNENEFENACNKNVTSSTVEAQHWAPAVKRLYNQSNPTGSGVLRERG
jgi:hypothetical protein